MSTSHVLIVDDQREVRRVLRAGLETLKQDISVIDVPSGEEAILVISQQRIDLLIADIRLPGISGFELKERARVRNPDLKLFLITGVQDERVKQEVINAGADAYFFKPIEMLEFLEAVQRCLNLEEPLRAEEEEKSAAEDARPSSHGISERLSRLRQELDAVCAVLIDENGQLMVQAGNVPEEASDPNLITSLMSTFNAATKVSYILGTDVPKDILYFTGRSYEFFLTHVGQSLALLIVVGVPTWDDEKMWKLLLSIRSAVQDFLIILSEWGVPIVVQSIRPLVPDEVELDEEILEEEMLPELEAIFKQKELQLHDVDAYWEEATEDSSAEVFRTDAISYDQARQLGLAPSEGDA